MQDLLIELKGIDFSYPGGQNVFTGLDFALANGDKIKLRGPNGSGKSTLLGIITGLLKPLNGEVFAFGRKRLREKDFFEVRARAGLLFQNSDDQLFCATVAEDVAFGPFNLGLKRHEVRDAVAHALDEVGLRGYEHRITYKLSGGEKRLVALAAVLAMNPEVLLLDEPSSGLDEEYSGRISSLIASLPKSMIVISHDKGFLSGLPGRDIELKNGCFSALKTI
jgi:cobalt/nickel transport system ATP-binding protein